MPSVIGRLSTRNKKNAAPLSRGRIRYFKTTRRKRSSTSVAPNGFRSTFAVS
ncbi:hypothetical protein GBP346_A1756 [Burkholderia pseudomallei MSHR346]|nr:hypothetical protein GBP346_A1756 [Burkholderia pseudomallei MSHR346]